MINICINRKNLGSGDRIGAVLYKFILCFCLSGKWFIDKRAQEQSAGKLSYCLEDLTF